MAGLEVETGEWGTEVIQRLNAALRGEATQAVRRGAYRSTKAYISRQMPKAVEIAQNMTDRLYPSAYRRDERRRPVPGAPHLNDSWSYSISSDPERGASLINTHPKAYMLLRGFDTASVIAPTNFVSFRTGTPVLMFPRGTNGVDFVSTSKAVQLAQPVTRPVPVSQRYKSDAETIPHMAIRQAFRQGRRA
jgi:hypothetical protein